MGKTVVTRNNKLRHDRHMPARVGHYSPTSLIGVGHNRMPGGWPKNVNLKIHLSAKATSGGSLVVRCLYHSQRRAVCIGCVCSGGEVSAHATRKLVKLCVSNICRGIRASVPSTEAGFADLSRQPSRALSVPGLARVSKAVLWHSRRNQGGPFIYRNFVI